MAADTDAKMAPLLTMDRDALDYAVDESTDEGAELHQVQWELQAVLAELDAQRRARFEEAEVLRRLGFLMAETRPVVARLRAELQKEQG